MLGRYGELRRRTCCDAALPVKEFLVLDCESNGISGAAQAAFPGTDHLPICQSPIRGIALGLYSAEGDG